MKKLNFLLLLTYLFIANIGLAQTAQNNIKLNNGNLKHSRALGLNLSTNGFGIQLANSILKNGKLLARLEGRYYHADISNHEIYFNGIKMQVNGYIKSGSIGILVDYHPFKNSFKFTTGFSILLNEVKNVAKSKDSVQQGNINISPDEIGAISIDYKVDPSPYFGIGFGRAIPKKRFGITAEIGFYYANTPKINYKCTGLLETTTTSNISVNNLFVRDIYTFPIIPVYNLGLNIRLGKI
ncbi:MAG: hypothetical protein ACEQSR_16630 [Candidatus Methylacidiphilales bacterium]